MTQSTDPTTTNAEPPDAIGDQTGVASGEAPIAEGASRDAQIRAEAIKRFQDTVSLEPTQMEVGK